MRARLDAPARVRLFPAMATLIIHVVAIGAALTWAGDKSPAAKGRNEHLTAFTIEKITPDPSGPRPAAEAKPRIIRQMGDIPTPPLPVAKVQGATATASVLPEALPAPTTARIPEADQPPKGRPHEVSPSQMDAYKMLLWRQIAARRPRGVQMSGSALVRFRLNAEGVLLSAEIAQSSGNVNLDQIALRTVRQASPLAKPPASLPDEDLLFTIPINFN